MSKNGTILSGIIERHALIVTNGITDKCTGVITRKRVTKNGIQESTIDLVLLSCDMLEDLVSIHIDEEKKNILTSITKTKNVTSKHESDHNSIETKFDIKWEEKSNAHREEVFNFNDSEGKKRFKELTEENTKLSFIFDNDESVEVQGGKFLKMLNRIIYQTFPKIRIKQSKDTKIDKLFRQQKILKNKTDKKSKDELTKVEQNLADEMAEDLYKGVLILATYGD